MTNIFFYTNKYLRWTPLDRELCSAIACVLVINDVSRKAEIRHFHHVLFSDETIPSCEVSMNVVVLFEVSHSATHLCTIVDNSSSHFSVTIIRYLECHV